LQRKETFEELRERMLKSAKEGIKSAYSSEEYALIQSVNAYLETEKSMNLAYERLTEWFGIYYPEVRMTNPKTLADLALAMSSKSTTLETIENALEDKQRAGQIFEKTKQTIGRQMNEEERPTVAGFAQMLKDMSQSMEALASYVKVAANRVLPNVTYLTDDMTAAELLSKAGSMERMALMPASTIQLLGAEKALFKHLKFGSKPPKYGVLFKFAVIGTAPREMRGKIARVYATKITIALKADYYSKNFIAPVLKKQLDAAVERIKSQPAKPKSARPSPERGAPQHGFPQRGGRPHGGRGPQRGSFGNNGNDSSRRPGGGGRPFSRRRQ
jgi:nucleolar protein 56